MRSGAIFDPDLELQAEAARRAHLGERLRTTVSWAYARAPRVREAMDLAGVSPGDIHGLSDLSRLPITRKDDLIALQAASPPFGGFLAMPVQQLQRIFVSPGPIHDPQGPAEDFWRVRPALAAAGFCAGDVVHNTASYHLTPMGFMFDGALRGLGCVVIPAGVGQTELQVRVASATRATGYVGTPSFLHALLTKARETGTPLYFENAFVSGEMLPEPLRDELERDFGVRVLQGYGTADLGVLAYECPQRGGLHLHPDVIVEVLEIDTREPCAPGQPGEVVATIFEEAYPLLRFATGDLSAWAPETACACGRTARKLAGVLGRVGDAVKVKGLFIRASQLDEVFKRFAAVARYQAIVSREQHQDRLQYIVELAQPVPEGSGWTSRLSEALHEAVKVRAEIQLVPAGTLPSEARKIADRRVW